MKPIHIIIIGAVASGAKTAAKARREDADAKITLITDEADISYASCGTPYFISDVIKDSNSLIVRTPDYFRKMSNIDVLTEHKVGTFNPKLKNVEIKDLKTGQSITLDYDKLVLAVGASIKVPKFEGIQHGNILSLHNVPSAIKIKSLLEQKSVKNAVIVGGGFIALEMAESMVSRGINTSLIIRKDSVLSNFDKDLALLVQNYIRSKGVKVLEEEEIKKFEADANGNVSNVATGKHTVPAELVLLAMGTKPNIQIAKDAGITIGETGAIKVNERMETNIPDVYAVGDCVESKHLVTGRPIWMPLATTSNKHGRVAGTNITGGNDVFPGILGTFVVKVFDWTVAATGISEKEAGENGFETETIIVPSNDKPHYYPGTKKIIVKLVADKKDGRLLGACIVGEGVVDKRIDVVATAIAGKTTVEQLSKLDLSYAPPYSSPMGPVITAANVLRNKLEGKTHSISPLKTKEKMDRNDDFILLDVRTKPEYTYGHIKGCINIPLQELPSKADQLDKTKEIIIYCGVGLRASNAHRILKNVGFKNSKFMEGSITAWPYPLEK